MTATPHRLAPARLRIAALSGSLRTGSANAALLRAAERVAPDSVRVVIEEDLGRLPHFNPDLDAEGAAAPAPVAALRASLSGADALLIGTPEYAHGVPGSLKNALDWIVSSGQIRGKPIGLIVASPSGGVWVRSSLTRTLEVMEARIVPDASLTMRDARQAFDATGKALSPVFEREIRRILEALAAAAKPSEVAAAGASKDSPVRLNLAGGIDPPVLRGSRP
jgi:chromate reductase, NAD(P)H dehydrogenase (quinone)